MMTRPPKIRLVEDLSHEPWGEITALECLDIKDGIMINEHFNNWVAKNFSADAYVGSWDIRKREDALAEYVYVHYDEEHTTSIWRLKDEFKPKVEKPMTATEFMLPVCPHPAIKDGVVTAPLKDEFKPAPATLTADNLTSPESTVGGYTCIIEDSDGYQWFTFDEDQTLSCGRLEADGNVDEHNWLSVREANNLLPKGETWRFAMLDDGQVGIKEGE
jgi:hypothetical protein